MMMWIWFGLTVALLATEIATTELVAVWFAAATLIMGLIAGFFPTLGIVWQILIFAVLTAVLVFATRPLVKKWMKRDKQKATNLDLIICSKALVTEEIDNDLGCGAVKINGLIWSARSEDGSKIENGTLVFVKEIQGNKAIVSLENKG